MKLDRARQHANTMLAAVTSATSDLVVAVDLSFNLLHFNDAWARQFAETFGGRPEAGDNLSDLLQEFPNER
ncbi:hypothetical protein R0K18_26185, partial [Pantoea sp. SIMBA_133]